MSFAESEKLRNLGRSATKALALLCAALLCTGLMLGMGGCTSEEEEEEEDDYVPAYLQHDYDSGSEDEDEEDEAEEVGEEEEAEVEEVETVEEEEEEDVAALAETTLNEDGIPISESMPYVGMDAKFIDVTWMGEHDGEDDSPEHGQWAGGTPYYWLADNDTGDRVFTAIVLDGEVVKVNKDNSYLDYWYDPDSILTLDYPDMDAAGEYPPEDDEDDEVDYPDTNDYNSAEEYADEAQGDFEAAGSDDPWNDAYDYWWDNY